MRDKIIYWAALAALLVTAGYLRFSGLMWGDYQYQHPDERFLVWVTADIGQVENIGQYFDTANSTLNPANRGHGFFVYGTLPVFATRYLVDALFDQAGWQEILQVGRALSAASDLLTVLLVYLTARRLMGRRLALLAGSFNAVAVLQIQQAHYFTVDSFATAFTMLAISLAVGMLKDPRREQPPGLSSDLRAAAGFGLAVGLAMACKLNVFPVALLLPVVLLLNWLRTPPVARDEVRALNQLVLGGLAAFLIFRLCQPYAFQGPTIFHLFPDQNWIDAIREQRTQAAGDVDFPPALQWARRPAWFSWQNLTVWGLGLPLGLAAWSGFVGLAAVLARRGFPGLKQAYLRMRASAPNPELHFSWAGLLEPPNAGLLLVWLWTAAYFAWQASAWNPTMRYQLPIYPTLTLLAAWGIGALWQRFSTHAGRLIVFAIGAAVAGLSLAWALAFVQIYQRTETRQAASLWIYNHVPGPLNLEIETPTGVVPQLLPVDQGLALTLHNDYTTTFSPDQSGWLAQINLPFSQIFAGDDPEQDARIVASLIDLETRHTVAASVVRLSELANSHQAQMVFDPYYVERGQRYGLNIHLASLGDALSFKIDGPVQLHLFAHQSPVAEGESPGIFQTVSSGTLRRVRLVVIELPKQEPTQLVITGVDGQARTAKLMRASGATAALYDLDPPLPISPGQLYLSSLERDGQIVAVPFHLQVLDGEITQSLVAPVQPVEDGDPLSITFHPSQAGELRAVSLWRAVQENALAAGAVDLHLTLADTRMPGKPLAQASQVILPARGGGDTRGRQVTYQFEPAIALDPARSYVIRLEVDGPGEVSIRGSAPANETDWDMGLPFRALGYDGFSGHYQRGLNLQLYWDDNAAKLQRFLDTLNQSDYIFISSNRQWGSTTRLPERYPLTTEYYRRLLGCPAEQDVEWCYRTADVGTYEGQLGFDLVQVFTSYPGWGKIKINTQFAEEAFTVYDHPKVFIFQKRADYDSQRVQAQLGAVDLKNVVHLTPRKAADWSSLMLPVRRWAGQVAGGTWAWLFPPEGLLNRHPGLAAACLWLFLALLGILVAPLVRRALPGLPDGGYPLSRMVGLLLLAYPVWLAGSLGITVTPLLILAVLLGLAALAFATAWRDRRILKVELHERAGYYLGVEALALVFYLAFLAVRMANPDLWHLYFGGEKPMDFSYFNAVLKSSTFPPYDPWFAGGLMNYYYYGFVIFGMPIKLLGITPAVAYNLLLPAQFSLVALGAFGLGWNLYRHGVAGARPPRYAWRAGLLAACLLLILGNLGTVRMSWEGWQRLAASAEQLRAASLYERAFYAWQGLQANLAGQAMAYYPGDWYWIPSRAIQPAPAGEITEYPFFTFLYGDLHAHVMALPVTLLVLAWALSVITCGARWQRRLDWTAGVGLGALAVGSLRAANSWDQPAYLAIAVLAVLYGAWKNDLPQSERPLWRRVLRGIVLAGLVLLLNAALFRPFETWFHPGYSEIKAWNGVPTDLTSYLTHWGLFIWILTAWLAVELVDWMASTPLSSLRRLQAFQPQIAAGGVAIGGLMLYLLLRGIQVAWLVIPLGAGCLVLLLRPGHPPGKRAAFFLAGSGLVLTLFVEVFALQGDRMNTVFKFYFQAWTLLSISAAAGLAWLLPAAGQLIEDSWPRGVRWAWLVVTVLLAAGCTANTVVATWAKINDRMASIAPTGLDGMAYMADARMLDGPPGGAAVEMDLGQDYRAIRWMQQNVTGSPVIVEMHTGEYRHWGSRFTIYTGLPAVIGWEYHQRQQRPGLGDWITHRIEDVQAFYLTGDRQQAQAFLHRYQVKYIIVGQLERIYAPGNGLNKFRALDGDLWTLVYQEGDTAIYQVK